ncbi:MAG: 3-ketoacyl-ACP reductase [Elusimicrobiota bacterium]|jgi:NAD(P)-dependent dehydrogenase (short-subunit alcohol dehydrogenase family)|nr:3-ketoacyl-ACP reductase [Elusimicrobiota bacterium]
MKQTALITGARRGIGRAIAAQLAKDGFNIVINAASPAGNDAFEDIKQNGADFLYIQGDVSKSADREKIVKLTIEKFKSIDVLVNNAGIAPKVRADLLDMSEESFDYVLSVNTKGNMFLTQIAAKQMIKQEIVNKRRGIIINISSASSAVSSTNRGEYCISKAAVSMLTTLYADRLSRESIFVYEIRPGVIKTDMTSVVSEKYNQLIKDGVFPIARWGTPQDIADAVSAFAGGKFLYTTGNFIDVDGGFHIRRL